MTGYESETAGLLLSLLTLGGAFIFWIFIFLFCIALWIVFSYPYYKMAKNAHLDNAWLVFVPVGCMYILLNLSRREFNIFNWIKTNDRTKVFKYYLICFGAYFVITMAISVLCAIPIIGFLFMIMSYLLSMAFSVAVYIFLWRINYDILMTYGMEEHAMWASIVSCFVPIVMVVFSFMIMNKEPDYTK